VPITRIKLYENWPAITEEVRKKAQVALGRAEEAALAEITGIWPHGGMHLEGVHPTVDGFASGVSAAHDKKHIAHFHDHGTLGNFRRGARTEPKRPRKRNYKMTRPDGEPTGIKAKRFYGKGRVAGKRALTASLFGAGSGFKR